MALLKTPTATRIPNVVPTMAHVTNIINQVTPCNKQPTIQPILENWPASLAAPSAAAYCLSLYSLLAYRITGHLQCTFSKDDTSMTL